MDGKLAFGLRGAASRYPACMTIGWQSAIGVTSAAALLVAGARRSGLPWHRALLGAATLVGALPHASLAPASLLSATGVGIAMVGATRPWLVATGLLLALGSGTLESSGSPELWPWPCAPRRLGTAVPLAAVAIGLYGLLLAIRPAPRTATGTLLTRVGPLTAGIVVAWLGTWRPPRPPLYNLPSGLAMWGLTAGLLGCGIHLARGGRPSAEVRLALALGVLVLAVTAIRTQPLGLGPVCGQLEAPLAALWLLVFAMVRLAHESPLPRVVDGLLVLQLIWMAG